MLFSFPSHSGAFPSGFPLQVSRTLINQTISGLSTAGQQETPLILVVDDDAETREKLRPALKQEGYRMVEATNAREGLEAYRCLRPDLVLLHAFMPIVDGFTCCTQLQALPEGDRTPVLMLSSVEDSEFVNRAFDVGATDFVTKPINWAVLRQRVRRSIRQSQLQKQLEAANRELQQLICIDSLTQVASRRYFDETLERELRRRLEQQTPLSLILCDVDYFKRYNDTYGHQAGDKCLQKIASAIGTAVEYRTGRDGTSAVPVNRERPQGNVVARYGGEEFAVILPRTDAAGAVKAAKQIRDRLQVLKIPHASSGVSPYVTLSLGVTCVLPGEDCSPDRLIRAADRGLYRAKHMGRDRLSSS